MPSPNCPLEASQFLARLRTSFWGLPLKDTCALGMSKLDEVCSQEGKAQGWNEVSRAHLFFLVILHQRHLGGIEAILEIESKIDNKLEAVGHALDQEGAAADLQIKEAFFVLQKAKMSVLADRSAYGYHSKPLAAIHSRFDEQARKVLFAESREACKAYISLLCLNFNFDCDEFQVSNKQVQANIDQAISLNSEFLEAKHSYSKYTLKITKIQLKNTISMPSKSVSALLDDLLARYPEGKHAISLYTFKSEQRKTQKNRIDNEKTIEILDKLTQSHQASARKELGLESSEEDNLFYPTRFQNFAMSLRLSSEKSGREQTLVKLDRLRHHRSKTTGLPREEDYELLLREAQTIGENPEFMIPELIDALQLLLAKHRKVSSLYQKVNCYHDGNILAILKNPIQFFEANPRIGAKYPAVAEIEAEEERLLAKILEADAAIRKEEGPEYDGLFIELIYGLKKMVGLRKIAESKVELESLREELTSRHSELLRQIEADEIKFSDPSTALEILEALQITVLSLLQVHDSKYSKEAKSLVERQLSKTGDCEGIYQPVALYFNMTKENGLLTLEEKEEALALLKEVNSDLFPPCEHAEMLRQFQSSVTFLKLQQMTKNIDEIKDRLQTLQPSDSEFSGLQKKYEEEKRALLNLIMDEDQRKKKDLKALEAEGCSRMNHFRKALDSLEFLRVFLPETEEPGDIYRVVVSIRAEILNLEEAFFEKMRENDPYEFQVLSLTEEFLGRKARYEFRLVTDCLEWGSALLKNYVTLSKNLAQPNSNAELDLHKQKCRMRAEQFPDVNSIIQDLEQQMAFDKQHPSLAYKVESYLSFIPALKLTQATKLFLEIDPSNFQEAMAVYNEFIAATAEVSPESQNFLMNFNINLILYKNNVADFVLWAEENWKYAKYLSKIQRPSMKTVMATTLVLGAAAVAWFKAASVKK